MNNEQWTMNNELSPISCHTLYLRARPNALLLSIAGVLIIIDNH
jgi:hypothetical protein